MMTEPLEEAPERQGGGAADGAGGGEPSWQPPDAGAAAAAEGPVSAYGRGLGALQRDVHACGEVASRAADAISGALKAMQAPELVVQQALVEFSLVPGEGRRAAVQAAHAGSRLALFAVPGPGPGAQAGCVRWAPPACLPDERAPAHAGDGEQGPCTSNCAFNNPSSPYGFAVLPLAPGEDAAAKLAANTTPSAVGDSLRAHGNRRAAGARGQAGPSRRRALVACCVCVVCAAAAAGSSSPRHAAAWRRRHPPLP
jgi:hypothetical protein